MNKKRYFLDVNNKKVGYRESKDILVFYFTEEPKFYIAHTFIKKSFIEKVLYEVSKDTYDTELAFIKEKTEPIEFFVSGIDEINLLSDISTLKAITDNMTVMDYINFVNRNN